MRHEEWNDIERGDSLRGNWRDIAHAALVGFVVVLIVWAIASW